MKKHYESAEKCCVDAEKHISDDPKEAELASCCADMDTATCSSHDVAKRRFALGNVLSE